MNDEASSRFSKSRKRIAGFCTFVFLAGVLVALLSWLLVDPFKDASRYNIQGMYEQPENTIQVATIGLSTLRRGFSPVRLMQKTGLQGYNCCTDAQPAVSSYYLLKELFESQRDSLSVVLLEISPLLKKEGGAFSKKTASVERVSGCMRLSPISIEYRWTIAQDYSDIDFFEQMIPVLRYHSRWNELTEDDFQKNEDGVYQGYFHGFPVWDNSYESNLTKKASGKYTYNLKAGVTDSVDYDKESLRSSWNKQCVKYFDNIVTFCRENGLS